MSTMRPREYIDAQVINVWAALLNNLERKRSEGSPRRFFTPVDAMVSTYLFYIYTNAHNQATNCTVVNIQSTLDPSINPAKSVEARYIDFETILQKEFQRCAKWISRKLLHLVRNNIIHFICI